MTEKELLYVEDAINHEIYMLNVCNELVECLNDENLSKFVKKVESKHKSILDMFMNLLED